MMLPRCGTLLTYGSALVMRMFLSPALSGAVGYKLAVHASLRHGMCECWCTSSRKHLAPAAWEAVPGRAPTAALPEQPS